jgi:hypothetical protein
MVFGINLASENDPIPCCICWQTIQVAMSDPKDLQLLRFVDPQTTSLNRGDLTTVPSGAPCALSAVSEATVFAADWYPRAPRWAVDHKAPQSADFAENMCHSHGIAKRKWEIEGAGGCVIFK